MQSKKRRRDGIGSYGFNNFFPSFAVYLLYSVVCTVRVGQKRHYIFFRDTKPQPPSSLEVQKLRRCRDSMDTHFSPVSPLDQNEETAGGAAADFACRHDRDRQCAAVGSRRSSSRSDGSGVARNVKQKGPNGVAIADGEAATPNSGQHITYHPKTRAPAPP